MWLFGGEYSHSPTLAVLPGAPVLGEKEAKIKEPLLQKSDTYDNASTTAKRGGEEDQVGHAGPSLGSGGGAPIVSGDDWVNHSPC